MHVSKDKLLMSSLIHISHMVSSHNIKLNIILTIGSVVAF